MQAGMRAGRGKLTSRAVAAVVAALMLSACAAGEPSVAPVKTGTLPADALRTAPSGQATVDLPYDAFAGVDRASAVELAIELHKRPHQLPYDAFEGLDRDAAAAVAASLFRQDASPSR